MTKGFSSCGKSLYVTDQNLNLDNTSYKYVSLNDKGGDCWNY